MKDYFRIVELTGKGLALGSSLAIVVVWMRPELFLT